MLKYMLYFLPKYEKSTNHFKNEKVCLNQSSENPSYLLDKYDVDI